MLTWNGTAYFCRTCGGYYSSAERQIGLAHRTGTLGPRIVKVVLPWIVLLVIGIAFFSYCVSAVNQISIASVIFEGLRATGCGSGLGPRMELDLTLVLQKPWAVAITGGTIQAAINGIPIGDGTIGYSQSNDVPVSICISDGGVYQGIVNAIDGGSFAYALEGSIGATFFGIISSSVPVQFSGHYP